MREYYAAHYFNFCTLMRPSPRQAQSYEGDSGETETTPACIRHSPLSVCPLLKTGGEFCPDFTLVLHPGIRIPVIYLQNAAGGEFRHDFTMVLHPGIRVRVFYL
jgi:hypothetical protein